MIDYNYNGLTFPSTLSNTKHYIHIPLSFPSTLSSSHKLSKLPYSNTPFPSTFPPTFNSYLSYPVSFNFRSSWWNVQRTNRKNKGLISADRNNKATLLLTIPRSTIVVCYGFILSNILYCYSEATKITLPCLGNPPCYDTRTEALFVIIWLGEGRNHRVLAWIPT